MPGKVERVRRIIDEQKRRLLNEEELRRTIDRLAADGELAEARADALRASLADTLQRSEYVLKHLGVHLGIGAIFAFDAIPLPLGTVSRTLWVAGSRVYEVFRRAPERARVHSLGVLLIAAIPLFGYLAYVFKLRQVSEDAAYLYANHVAYARRGSSLSNLLKSKPRLFTQVAGWLVPVRIE